MSDLCAKAGISRQWLNKCVDLGKVPDCERQENGRLRIVEGDQLERWIRDTSVSQRKKRGKRLSLQQRLDRVNPTGIDLTVAELARESGLTSSAIRRRVLEIPGARFDGRCYRFSNSPKLKFWIESVVAERYLNMEKIRRQRIRFPSSEFLRAGGAINRAFVGMIRLLKSTPTNTWTSEQLSLFHADLTRFSKFANSFEVELTRRKARPPVSS